MNISGSIALVTGGASGLGLATTVRLHEAGASVVILDLPGSNGLAVAHDLGPRAAFAPGDVTSPADVDAALDAAGALAGGVPRIVVNCAGIGTAARTTSKDGPFPLESFTRVIQVNLIGTFNVIRLAAYRMSQAEEEDGERGVIVNTALVAHIVENPMLNGETIRLDGAIRMGPRLGLRLIAHVGQQAFDVGPGQRPLPLREHAAHDEAARRGLHGGEHDVEGQFG